MAEKFNPASTAFAEWKFFIFRSSYRQIDRAQVFMNYNSYFCGLLTQAVLMNWVIIAARREGSGSATIQVATHPDAALNLEIMAATLGDRLGSV